MNKTILTTILAVTVAGTIKCLAISNNFDEVEAISYDKEEYAKLLIMANEHELEKQRLENVRKANVDFDFNDVRKPSGLTREEMLAILSSEHVVEHNLLDVSDAFIEAEELYGINALVLLGLVCLESDYGRSDRAVGPSKNMGGIEVYTDDSPGKYYDTRYDSVMDIAYQLSKYYLIDGAMYYNGYGIDDINIYYSADKEWNKKINIISGTMLKLYKEIAK